MRRPAADLGEGQALGGGATGAGCLCTAHRRDATSQTQLDSTPERRNCARTCGHCGPRGRRRSGRRGRAEGGARRYDVAVQGLRRERLRPRDGVRRGGGEHDAAGPPRELALLAIGLRLGPTGPGALPCGADWQTDAPGVRVRRRASRCAAHRGSHRRGAQRRDAVDAHRVEESDPPSPVTPWPVRWTVV